MVASIAGMPSSPTSSESARVELTLDGITHGGEAVGRMPNGKACFVPYAIPGERVLVEVTEERKRWARARLVEVLEASPARVEPPCVYARPGRCGGCQLQHIDPTTQLVLKRRIVTEQLERIGHLEDPPVNPTMPVAAFHYRNSARFAVDQQGRLGFRRAGSHDVQPIDECLLLDPAVQGLRDEAGDGWQGAEEIVVRAGLATGDRALIVRPGAEGLPPMPEGPTPVALEGPTGAVALRGEPGLTEMVEGRTFHLSPTSFFQASTAGAALLVRLVLAGAEIRPGETALDLYAGVGLFAAFLADAGARVTAVDADPVAAADARHNLAKDEVSVLEEEVAAQVAALVADHEQYDVVVLDPPRRGAGARLCGRIAELEPRVVVYVSCDPAALARDAAALAGAGYELSEATPIDQFAQTAQIETVAVFRPVHRLAETEADDGR